MEGNEDEDEDEEAAAPSTPSRPAKSSPSATTEKAEVEDGDDGAVQGLDGKPPSSLPDDDDDDDHPYNLTAHAGVTTPRYPPPSLRKKYAAEAGHRINVPTTSSSEASAATSRALAVLAAELARETAFEGAEAEAEAGGCGGGLLGTALREAFVLCCLDPRRLPFLSAHLSQLGKEYDDDLLLLVGGRPGGISTGSPPAQRQKPERQGLVPAADAVTDSDGGAVENGTQELQERPVQPDGTASTAPHPTVQPSTRLMLYLELVAYRDLYSLIPPRRRKDYATRIAHKFLLPPSPAFDVRPSLVRSDPTGAALSELERRLAGGGGGAGLDLFDDVRSIIERSLWSSGAFVSFLLEEDCARMRGYLRGTAPYVNAPLGSVLDAVVSLRRGERGGAEASDVSPVAATAAAAHNYLVFLMLYLICQSDTDEIGDNDASLQVGTASGGGRGGGKRLMGSAGGISYAVYVRRDMLPKIREASDSLSSAAPGNGGGEKEEKCYRSLIRSYENLWETYIAPGGGILDSLSNSNETQAVLNEVRRSLVNAVELRHPSTSSSGNSGRAEDEANVDKDQQRLLLVVRALVEPGIVAALDRLAEELLYDYATNVHPKFREHKFHEWMCEEVHRGVCRRAGLAAGSDTAAAIGKESTEEGKVADKPCDAGGWNDILPLPEGCVARLMRKVELPNGVSRHRPLRLASTQTSTDSKHEGGDLAAMVRSAPAAAVVGDNKKANVNAEYAVVFGTDDGMDSTGRMPDPAAIAVDVGAIRRFAFVPLGGEVDAERILEEGAIPATLEKYAVVCPFRDIPFSDAIDDGRVSNDGWEVSLINIMIPNAHSGSSDSEDDPEGSFVYGVTLVFNQTVGEDDPSTIQDESKIVSTTELVHTNDFSSSQGEDAPLNSGATTTNKSDESGKFQSPISISLEKSDDGTTTEIRRKIRVSTHTPEFNRRLREMRWSERVKKRKSSAGRGATIGIALISGRNTIPAMRETLSRLFDDFSSLGEERLCDPLVDILGNLSQIDVENVVLNSVLEPYLKFGSSRWISVPRPLAEQKLEFDSSSGDQLIQSLPPIPLALLFVTALLEQKIVVSSRRRSILVSATTALRSLLKPLAWSHLFVPLVPASMAGDLVQYPAPFILGIPSEDEDSHILLNSLPDDVTLVDLDVGRVILASTLANEDENNVSALRFQVLFLAETLGGVFGARMQGQTWRCDSPLSSFYVSDDKEVGTSSSSSSSSEASDNARNEDVEGFAVIQSICKDFIIELLSGSTSCCFWIEEERLVGENCGNRECNVLFDEDRFFHIKSLRAEDRYMPLFMGENVCRESAFGSEANNDGPIRRSTCLALSVDDFDLVLEAFLRCQGMSLYMSSRPRKTMAFS